MDSFERRVLKLRKKVLENAKAEPRDSEGQKVKEEPKKEVKKAKKKK